MRFTVPLIWTISRLGRIGQSAVDGPNYLVQYGSGIHAPRFDRDQCDSPSRTSSNDCHPLLLGNDRHHNYESTRQNKTTMKIIRSVIDYDPHGNESSKAIDRKGFSSSHVSESFGETEVEPDVAPSARPVQKCLPVGKYSSCVASASNLLDAIKQLHDGDTVAFCAGSSINLESDQLVARKNFEWCCQGQPGSCAIELRDNHVTFVAEQIRFQGISFEHGYSEKGGAVNIFSPVQHTGDFEIIDCKFNYNRAKKGGLYAKEGTSILLSGTNFTDNKTHDLKLKTGAVLFKFKEVIVNDCHFRDEIDIDTSVNFKINEHNERRTSTFHLRS